ncbi:MAG TPA: trypsin-like peptidase domain-containing protein [Propionibacteriaceae bacterium]|nr:trypsin-like peptidase domain-containing protein [Propionibacteriaceae bacterium]
MVDEDRPTDHAEGEPSDSRYFGPLGEPPASAPGAQPFAPPGPAFAAQDAVWPPPLGQPAVAEGPPGGITSSATTAILPPGLSNRRRPRLAPVIAVAALTALLIGGAAGYGGATLARRADSSPTTASPTAATPGVTRTPVAPAPDSANTVEVAKRVLPATVMIQVGRGTGSGFVIDQEGHIVTNNHVVADAANGSRIRVIFSDSRRYSAVMVGRSPSYDLAVIKVSGATSLTPLELGDSDQIQIGEPVIAVGSPLGLPGTVTQGIISARDRPVMVSEGADADSPTAYINAIQTDAPINPGNSGGPLVDAGARVIGVNSAILTFAASRNIGLGFAIPINQAATIADLLIKNGKATYPVIGANVQDASSGVQLTEVDAQGPAGKAGLRVGDLITGIDGEPIDGGMEQLIVTIRARRPGDVVVLNYTRGSARGEVRVTLGSKVG